MQYPISVCAHTDIGHDREMETILWGNKKTTVLSNEELKIKVRCLKDATSIALDQFNGTKAIQMKNLENYGVEGIPPLISDTIEKGGINFTANGLTHRKYTHLGWTYVYSGKYSDANWPKRKEIMINTVMKVLDTTDEEICDSFAAILYYIHILGDIQDDSIQTQRDQVIPLIDKQGISDILHYRPNKDIFLELSHYIPILFEGRISKTYLSYYSRLKRQISKLHRKAKDLLKENKKKGTVDKNINYLTSKQLNELSEELMAIMAQNMPVLLEHSIFEGVFYL